MKKFLLMAAVGTMMFSACSNDDNLSEIASNGEARPVELSMDFTVSSGAETRAGRPLYSSEALQRVNNLQLYIFKDGKFEKSEKIEAFNNDANQGNESHTYKFTPQLENGQYQFLAVGFEEAEAYKTLNFTKGTTTLDEAALELNDGKDAAEVFAGVSAQHTVSDNTKSLTASVTLNRTVAGVLGYFKNIPYEVEKGDKMNRVMKVCVELVNKGTAVNLKENTTKSSTSAAYKMLTIDLTNETKADDGNYYKKEANSANPATVANSFLAGGYVLPFNKTVGQSTFKVVLYGEGDAVLKTYKVQVEGSSNSELDVLANHFYSLGHKSKDNNTDGTDPENPEGPKDPDKPIDLSKDQVITITVNADWETIHDLELGDEEQ